MQDIIIAQKAVNVGCLPPLRAGRGSLARAEEDAMWKMSRRCQIAGEAWVDQHRFDARSSTMALRPRRVLVPAHTASLAG